MRRTVILALAVVSLLSSFIPVMAQKSKGAVDKGFWVSRYMSVCYPLKEVSVTSSYGQRKDPFTGKRAVHSGLDLKANNEPVMSMFDGIVEDIGSDSRSGRYIILRHGLYTVSYCHLSDISVPKGASVLAGDIVGITGNTGRSTGPHLHITAKRDGDRVNPLLLLRYVSKVRSEAVEALGGTPAAMPKALVEADTRRRPATGRDSAPLMKFEDCADFFKSYARIAMEHQKKYGIPASVTLSQMAWESGYGNSDLARRGKNFFGIKASREWLAKGKPYSVHDDDRKNEKFCNYSTVEESIDHHSRLLMSDRYRKCRQCDSTDYHGWLVALKKGGYATAKDYVKSVEQIITRYKLYLYDQLAVRA